MNELCQTYREHYGEPDLSPALQDHAAQCEACREFARKQEALSEMLPAWQAPDASPDFALSVMGRIAESQRAPQTVGEWFKRLFSTQLAVPLPAAAFASLLLMVSLPMNLFFLSSQTGDDRLAGRQVAEAPFDNTANVGHLQPTLPAGQVIQVNQAEQSIPGLSLPPNLYGAGAFLLIPIVDPLMMTHEASAEQTPGSSDI